MKKLELDELVAECPDDVGLVDWVFYRMQKQLTDFEQQPKTPAARWRENGELDPHGGRFTCERHELPLGHLTDDEMANEVFLRPLIGNLQAAKDRIRWLSRQVVKAATDRAFIEAVKPHLVVHESGTVELHMLIVRNENCVRMEGDAAVAHIAGGVWACGGDEKCLDPGCSTHYTK